MSQEVARLVEQAQHESVQLTSEGGLLPDMIKQAVEAALQGEMTAHLGYERYAAEAVVRATGATARRPRSCRPPPAPRRLL